MRSSEVSPGEPRTDKNQGGCPAVTSERSVRPIGSQTSLQGGRFAPLVCPGYHINLMSSFRRGRMAAQPAPFRGRSGAGAKCIHKAGRSRIAGGGLPERLEVQRPVTAGQHLGRQAR
jgi:hypothetical protein